MSSFASKVRASFLALAVSTGTFAVANYAFADHKTPDSAAAVMADGQITSPFSGAKVNGGNAAAKHQDNNLVLTLSDDFKVPNTPAPHWQVVDSAGNTYLLNRL